MTGTDVSKWADSSMFTAEKSTAADGVKAYLLGGPVDPLGQIAACAKMYKGEVVRDLRDVTDEERRSYLREIQKTVLKMPLEAVSLHFMLEGVHRGITHQMVRQRTAAYAQESTRFAVKEDLAEATALPPSLEGTLGHDEWVAQQIAMRRLAGLKEYDGEQQLVEDAWLNRTDMNERQAHRAIWDDVVGVVGEAYNGLVNSGMPAEEARGLMPTNITTRLNYITNLRSFYDTMAVRVSDQAQFEWRHVAMAYAKAMREYGERSSYLVWINERSELLPGDNLGLAGTGLESRMNELTGCEQILVRRSSSWQYTALTHEIKPIEFKIGGPAFGADFDRPSRIGERVRAFHSKGIPSSEWTTGSVQHGIPPIHPDEWLLDPNSARLDSSQEFNVFGDRVPKGTGWHWMDTHGGVLVRNTNGNQTDGYDVARWLNEHSIVPLDIELSEEDFE